VSPETKALEIKMLQDQGKKVIMVGDGMNNAPELIGLGGGTCAALSSGYIMRMKSGIRQILYTLGLSQYSLRKVKQNYLCHFFYNNIDVCWIISWCYKFSCA
jgi:P-type Cu+ transporter